MIDKPLLTALVFITSALVSTLGENLLSCQNNSSGAFGYSCQGNEFQNQCDTFALLRANSYYSSLSNLSFYLGINAFELAEANGFSDGTDQFLPKDRPLLIPIDCKCNSADLFEAQFAKITVNGESFYDIAEALEGLTTCKAIHEKNPSVSPWNLPDRLQLLIPLRCACPFSSELGPETKILLSYPVSEGDTLSKLGLMFNITPGIIISANNRTGEKFRPESLVPASTLLIPLEDKPILGFLEKPREPDLRYPQSSIPISSHRRKSKMRTIGIYIVVSAVAFGLIIATAAGILVIQWKKKKQNSGKMEDVELQQLSLSVRTTSEKKVSFEGSQDPSDGPVIDVTPQKMPLEAYTLDELKKATEDFNSSNLIEESVFHGRLNGKNLAIKRTNMETITKIEFGLVSDPIHHHPSMIRLLGTCLMEGSDSYLIFEYAKNGSLKDWLHGGLAVKSQFIASCYCFLTWNQRLRICLDIASALQYMHHIMNPTYIHKNIKSRNIFLDEEFNAKLGNFGMARCTEDVNEVHEESCLTNPASWSKGYLAPEYLHQGVIANSIDIFAYGVVLLEVLSGQTPVTRLDEKGGGSVWLAERIKFVLQSEDADELRQWMDKALGENYSFDAAVTMANLARACVEDDPSLRPNAAEIVEKLSVLVEELPEVDHLSICESSSKPLVKASSKQCVNKAPNVRIPNWYSCPVNQKG